MDYREYVLKHVTRQGNCGFGIKEVENSHNVQDLISLLLTPKGVEHCMKFRFPDIDFLLPHKEELLKNSIFVEGEHSLNNPRLVVVFGGKVKIKCDQFTVTEIYATNDAEIDIQAFDNAFVSVELHHKSKMMGLKMDNSKILEFRK